MDCADDFIAVQEIQFFVDKKDEAA